MLTLRKWMRQHNGVAHSTSLRAAGYSELTVRNAVRSGRLIRVRRSWLIDPACSPARRAAAEAGGRITCVTAAAELGLWTLAADEVHVALAHSASRINPTGLALHWAQGPIAVPTRSAEEPLINILFHTARCLDRVHALAIWESALRKRLITPAELERIRWRSTAPSDYARVASLLSDSGLESHFCELMRRIGIDVIQQAWIDGHPVDALIGDALVIQIDGFTHHRAADRRRDIRADARLVLQGCTVLRFDYQQVLFDEEFVQSTIRTAVAQRLHRRRTGARR